MADKTTLTDSYTREKEISDLGAEGLQIGQSAADLVGFHGVAPSIQQTKAVAVATTASTTTTPYGFTTAAQADSIVTAVNAIIDILTAKGLTD